MRPRELVRQPQLGRGEHVRFPDFGETACLGAGPVRKIRRLARTASSTALLETTAKGRLAIRVGVALWFSLQPSIDL